MEGYGASAAVSGRDPHLLDKVSGILTSLDKMSKRSRSYRDPSMQWQRRCLPIKEKPNFWSILTEA